MASPILRLPYDPSLTLAGIEYAKQSLHYTYSRMQLGPADRLRKIVAGVAVELAFRRWLQAQGARFDLLGATPFTEPDRYDLRLGGRRCDIKSFLVSDRGKIRAMRRNPDWLLQASALVPEDQFRGEALTEQDFYVFGFLAGLETRGREDLRKAMRAEQPVHLLHAPSAPHWRPADAWRSLGRLSLAAAQDEPIEVEVGGQGGSRAALCETLHLTRGATVETAAEYYSLLYLHVPALPAGPLRVSTPAPNQATNVDPGGWHNVWIYGLEIFMAGWLTKAEFRALGRPLPAGSETLQYARTAVDNRAVPVSALRPVSELVELVKAAERPRP